jgi:hypothetical protein
MALLFGSVISFLYICNMKRYIIDNKGKQMFVTDIHEAIKQAEMYSKFDPSHIENTTYWTHVLNQLKKLKAVMDAEPVPVKVIDEIADKLPVWVKEMREKYRQRLTDIGYTDVNISQKSFSKDKKDSPLFGPHSCVRTLENLNRLDKLEIGETWDRGWGRPSITRIF